jgi:hypothetical protein
MVENATSTQYHHKGRVPMNTIVFGASKKEGTSKTPALNNSRDGANCTKIFEG